MQAKSLQLNANASLENTLKQYRSRLLGSVSDVREYVALIDFHIRLVYTLAIAESQKSGAIPLRIAAMPGFGTMVAAISGSTVETTATTPEITKRVRSLTAATRSALDAFKVPKRYATFKTMRDQLSHGHPLPTDNQVLQAMLDNLSTLEKTLTESLAVALKDLVLAPRPSDSELTLLAPNESLNLVKLWRLAADNELLEIYSHFSNDEIYYIAASGDATAPEKASVNSRFAKDVLVEKKASNTEISRFLQDILTDVSAFTEDYSRPSYYFGDDSEVGIIFVPWTRSTSDENTPRIDSFRVGTDSRKEWWDQKSKAWKSYSIFLRTISGWQVLARRIGIGLESLARTREEEEISRLGGGRLDTTRGPSNLRERHDDLAEKNNKEFKLANRVDEACQVVKPSTSVFFLVGQAGLGKTDLMLSLARERAEDISNDANNEKPLYLFVSSTGRTLASLDDAVNSSLNITKLLSSHSARALCRNGLLVLLVDGFDELLGSSGYENALGSLEPWLRDLSGRGVLVASARSSYYLTQYRRSLESNTSLNVDHTLVELQPWTKQDATDYLLQRSVPKKSLSTLTEGDWKVLGVPFFSKAFAAWFEGDHKQDEAPLIFDIVVNQYLAREASKLRDPQIGELLNPAELNQLFSEIAEMMQLSRGREIEQSDLVLCAQQVIGNDLDAARPGLSRRLASLCGLGVTSSDGNQNQFGFAHELLFDCFLSSCLQSKAHAGTLASAYLNLLKKSKINAAVFDWLLTKVANAQEILPQLIHFGKIDGRETQALSENLGTLWLCLLNKSHGVPPSNRALGIRLGELTFSETGWSTIELNNCTIEQLDVPAHGNSKINAHDCEIELLTCASGDHLKHAINGLENCKVLAVHIDTLYGDNPARVREILQSFGAIPERESESSSETADAATYYLERLSRRPEVLILVARDSKIADQDDPRVSWTTQLGEEHWRAFVDALVSSSLAKWETVTASGKAKLRLVLNVAPSAILDHRESPPMHEFWSKLA